MQFGPEVEPAGPKRVCARLSSREQEWEGKKKVVWRGVVVIEGLMFVTLVGVKSQRGEIIS